MTVQDNVVQVIGQVAIDEDYRARFFEDVETTLAGYDLNPVEEETLRHMADCPVTRIGTAMVNKSHGKHEAAARQAVTAV